MTKLIGQETHSFFCEDQVRVGRNGGERVRFVFVEFEVEEVRRRRRR